MNSLAENAGVTDFGEDVPSEFRFSYGKQQYVLREPLEGAVIQYRKRQTSGAKMNPETKQVELGSDVSSIPAFLLSMCVFKLVGTEGSDQKEQPVPFDVLCRWRSPVVKQLFEKAKDMGDLREDDTEADLARRLETVRKREALLKNGQSGADGTTP